MRIEDVNPCASGPQHAGRGVSAESEDNERNQDTRDGEVGAPGENGTDGLLVPDMPRGLREADRRDVRSQPEPVSRHQDSEKVDERSDKLRFGIADR